MTRPIQAQWRMTLLAQGRAASHWWRADRRETENRQCSRGMYTYVHYHQRDRAGPGRKALWPLLLGVSLGHVQAWKTCYQRSDEPRDVEPLCGLWPSLRLSCPSRWRKTSTVTAMWTATMSMPLSMSLSRGPIAENAAGKRFLLARASRGREVLAESLRAAGGDVEQVVVYESQQLISVTA